MNESENKVWIFGWCTVGVLALASITGVTLVSLNKDAMIRDMVKAGADPLEAHCSMNGSHTTIACALVASNAAAKLQ